MLSSQPHRNRRRQLSRGSAARELPPREPSRDLPLLLAARAEAGHEVSVEETRDRVHIRIDLPVRTAQEVEVRLADDLLTVTAERSAVGATGAAAGAASSRFARSFLLPHPVRPDAVTAAFAAGTLCVEIDKRSLLRPRRIPID